MIRAGKWLDEPSNRAEAVEILSMSQYVGAPKEVLANSMTGTFEFEKGDKRSKCQISMYSISTTQHILSILTEFGS